MHCICSSHSITHSLTNSHNERVEMQFRYRETLMAFYHINMLNYEKKKKLSKDQGSLEVDVFNFGADTMQILRASSVYALLRNA